MGVFRLPVVVLVLILLFAGKPVAFHMSLGQEMRLLFPPTRRPTQEIFSDNKSKIWTFEQPFITTADIKSRMTVIKLGSDVLVYSPIACTEECVDMIKTASGSLPTHVLMQNNAIDHTLFLKGWKNTLPSANILAVSPSLADFDEPLLADDDGDEGLRDVLLPEHWLRQGLDAALLDVGPVFQEVVLYHRPSRSLLCADAIWRVQSATFSPNIVADVGWKYIFGVKDRSAFPYWFYFPQRKRREIRSFLDKVSSWDIDRVIPGHLDTITEENCGDKKTVKQIFLESFDYIF